MQSPAATPERSCALQAWRRRAWPYVLLVAAVLGGFGRVVSCDFIRGDFDDKINILNNPWFRELSWQSFSRFWQAPYERLFIPLTYNVWGMLVLAAKTLGTGELAAWPFHGVNLLLHVLNALLVYRLLVRLFPGTKGALLGALLFALHPLQAEPVAWVSGLKDVLFSFFGLVALNFHVAASTARLDQRRALWRREAVALVAFILALLAKPTAIVLPAVMGIIDLLVLRRSVRRSLTAPALWLAAALPLVVLTKSVQADAEIGFIAPHLARITNAAWAIGFYIKKLVIPLDLGTDYGMTPDVVIGRAPSLWAVALGATALVLGFAVAPRMRRTLLAPAAVFLVCLAPVLGFISFIQQGLSLVVDRYMYLAMLGPALLVARLWQRPSPALAVAALRYGAYALVIGLGVLTSVQTGYWRSNTTLFSHSARVNPTSWVAHYMLAMGLRAEHREEEALAEIREAIRLKPGYWRLYEEAGFVAQALGRGAESDDYEGSAARLYAELMVWQSRGFVRAGRYENAAERLREALRVSPKDPELHVLAADNFARMRHWAEARAEYLAALALAPDLEQASLGLALAQSATH